ncbi:MAG: 4'-phosphopantetheinyl transferase superfamily protein [Methylococcaceae bacterium]|nr:4'-phosphopantetheinyl transferase superfamily protein [Methylococcaceae bacterium]
MSQFCTLQHGAIDVWYADFGQLSFDQERCYAVLDAAERVRVAKFRFQSLCDRAVQSHGLLRMLLGHYLQVSPAALNINRTAQGKPYLKDYPALSFNMSHSGAKLLIAVTEGVALGVDIEEMKARTHTAGIVAKCFAAEEQVYWQSLSDIEKMPGFFDFWTRKEAFVKAVGQGISLGLEQCVINPKDLTRLLRIPNQCGSVAAWRIADLDVDVACRAAVVARLEAFKVNVFLLDDYLTRLM